MKKKFANANVVIENRKGGVQPATFIFENGRVYMVTITPDHQFTVTDEGPIGFRYDENCKWCGGNTVPRIANTWADLDGLESDKYVIKIEADGCAGWIMPKEETEETKGENYFQHHKYLSTHSFYAEHDTYKNTMNILKEYGFNVIINPW